MVLLPIIQVLLLMNITHLNKGILLLFFLYVFTQKVNAQEKSSSDNKNFALSATIGNGLTAIIAYNNSFADNIFYSPSVRLLWKPNHLLNIGVESAYLTVSKQDSTLASTAFGETALRARLNAIPLLVVFNMKISKIDLYYGIGISSVTSRLEAFGDRVVVTNWYYCYNLAIAYSYPIARNIEIGIEAKSYFFPKLQKISGGLHVNLSYYFLRW